MPKPTKKFLAKLEVYVEWAKCSTPFSAWHGAIGFPPAFYTANEPEGEIPAADVQFSAETFGIAIKDCTQPQLLAIYRQGKANRDFWTKEIDWWRKHAMFLEEEFAVYLTPKCFDELFGQCPRPHLVRYFHDNSYSEKDFEADCEFRLKGFERLQEGVLLLWHDASETVQPTSVTTGTKT